MEYTIENEYLTVTVTTWGAQVKSVRRKCDGVEHMWQADKSVWGYHAPVLFPYTGRLKDGKLTARGETVENGLQHGFARTSEHVFTGQSDTDVTMELRDSPVTRALWPWSFCLRSRFALDGFTLRHTLTVENTDTEAFRFGIGFHPAFAIPFDGAHVPTDYELRFEREESPICLVTAPRGLLTGETYRLGSNIRAIPITEGMFDNDSHCMVNLASRTLGLYERGTGRGVVCSLEGFPYCLIWSKPGLPRFVCIEPWNSLPSAEDGGIDWEEKPAAARVNPGQSWSTTLTTAFVR